MNEGDELMDDMEDTNSSEIATTLPDVNEEGEDFVDPSETNPFNAKVANLLKKFPNLPKIAAEKAVKDDLYEDMMGFDSANLVAPVEDLPEIGETDLGTPEKTDFEDVRTGVKGYEQEKKALEDDSSAEFDRLTSES